LPRLQFRTKDKTHLSEHSGFGVGLEPLRAVVVDDDKDTVQVFAEYLQIHGVSVVAVGYDGKDAIDAYQKYRPDILFLDMHMPQYDGVYALKEIRAIDPMAAVVVITADLTGDSAVDLGRYNPTEVIFKPFEIDKITNFIERFTKEHNLNEISDQAKKALVSFTVEQTLLKMGKSILEETGNLLYAKYKCYFSDCLDHPEYLADVLREIFGNAHTSIITEIKKDLTKFKNQEPISNFLTVISR